jgi:septation ring formation regulator EzrA
MTDELRCTALGHHLADLERELSIARLEVSTVMAAARESEARAMGAIKRADDITARRALVEQMQHANARAALEADVEILDSMIDECRRVVLRRC